MREAKLKTEWDYQNVHKIEKINSEIDLEKIKSTERKYWVTKEGFVLLGIFLFIFFSQVGLSSFVVNPVSEFFSNT